MHKAYIRISIWYLETNSKKKTYLTINIMLNTALTQNKTMTVQKRIFSQLFDLVKEKKPRATKESINVTGTSNITLNNTNIDTSYRSHKEQYLPSSHRAPLKPEIQSRGQQPVT